MKARNVDMEESAQRLVCKRATGTAWIMCPVCRRGKLLKLTKGTRAKELVLFCRNCKQETVVSIVEGDDGGRGWPVAKLEQ